MKAIADMSRDQRRHLTQQLIGPLLAEHGRRGLSRIVGVTSEAVRGWRNGRAAHPSHLEILARLADDPTEFAVTEGVEDAVERDIRRLDTRAEVRDIRVCSKCGVLSCDVVQRTQEGLCPNE